MFLALQNFATFEHIARKKNEQEGWFWKIGTIARVGADKVTYFSGHSVRTGLGVLDFKIGSWYRLHRGVSGNGSRCPVAVYSRSFCIVRIQSGSGVFLVVSYVFLVAGSMCD